MRNVWFALLTLAATAACMGPYYPAPQSASAAPNISIVNNSTASTSGWTSASTRESMSARPPPATRDEGASSELNPAGKDPRSVLILQGTHLDRTAEVLGQVDVPEDMANEAAALQRLRERAAAIGADAVVRVEFHHGEGATSRRTSRAWPCATAACYAADRTT